MEKTLDRSERQEAEERNRSISEPQVPRRGYGVSLKRGHGINPGREDGYGAPAGSTLEIPRSS